MSELVSGWEENNFRLGVTSFLLRLENHFLQLIEGPPRAVSGLMDRIWDDARHHDLQILLTGHDSQHHSDGHGLGYVDLVSEKADESGRLQDIGSAWEELRNGSPALHDWLDAHAHAHTHTLLQPRGR